MKHAIVFLSLGIILSLQIAFIAYNQNESLRNNNKDKNNIIEQLILERDSLILILDSLPLGYPLDSIKISEEFGIRRHPITKRWRQHSGVDLAGTYMDTIYAVGSGIVIKAGRYRGYGRCVIIKHKEGYESLYGHMNKVFVKKGNKVKDGDPIGTVGSTGFSTGTHLHYEISRNGKFTDPKHYLNN